jgi:hypothetical protein
MSLELRERERERERETINSISVCMYVEALKYCQGSHNLAFLKHGSSFLTAVQY